MRVLRIQRVALLCTRSILAISNTGYATKPEFRNIIVISQAIGIEFVSLTDRFVNIGQVRFRRPSSLFAFATTELTCFSHESL